MLKNIKIITARRNRRSVELIVIVTDGKRYEKVVCLKGTVKKSIIRVSTVKVDSRVFRPEWSAVLQIVVANLHGLK